MNMSEPSLCQLIRFTSVLFQALPHSASWLGLPQLLFVPFITNLPCGFSTATNYSRVQIQTFLGIPGFLSFHLSGESLPFSLIPRCYQNRYSLLCAAGTNLHLLYQADTDTLTCSSWSRRFDFPLGNHLERIFMAPLSIAATV